MSAVPGKEARRPLAALALVGFMACGKSLVGRAAAGILRVPFVDTDALIEAQAGHIPTVFALRGERGFRELERDVVVQAIRQAEREPRVLALGGGAVLSGDVREALLRLPHVAWLTAPPEVLWARAQASGPDERPLAQDEQVFRRLLEERTAFYREVATAVVANDGTRPLAAVVEAVVALAAATTAGAAQLPRLPRQASRGDDAEVVQG